MGFPAGDTPALRTPVGVGRLARSVPQWLLGLRKEGELLAMR